jgi:Fe2+ transport system protein FeoA
VSKTKPADVVVEGQCADPSVCPLTRVKPGAVVCIKQLLASPELTDRLRELGLGEEQQIKLLSCQANYICQVCNARLGISEQLAERILVEPLPAEAAVA